MTPARFGVCPSCSSADIRLFYELDGVPTHSVVLLPTYADAVQCVKGDIKLCFCHTCGFIFNPAFNPQTQAYASRYEAPQSYSPTFNRFHRYLARRLIKRLDLKNKTILEIGCGNGQFLTLLCRMGRNQGIGFDPAYTGERNGRANPARITFIKDVFSEKYGRHQADFICCKMTLEHIQKTADFVKMVRRCIDERTGTAVFFQVPDVTRILNEIAFWDIYYEHCSYFSPGSLGRLFRHCGFSVTDIRKEYGDQYLTIEARVDGGNGGSLIPLENDLDALASAVDIFEHMTTLKRRSWTKRITQMYRAGEKIVLWGSSSKTVAFLSTLKINTEIQHVVDINPHRQNTHIAGTGQKIVPPLFLKHYRPDVVLIPNPVYGDEIRQALEQMDLNPELVPFR